MRYLPFLVGLACSLFLAGCGTPPEGRLDAPVMTVGGFKADGGASALTLRLVNSNAVPVAVVGATHTLFAGGERLGRIEDKTAVGLPALGGVTHTVAVPAKLAAEIAAYAAKHPEAKTLVVESSLVVAVSGDDTITLKTTGAGSLK